MHAPHETVLSILPAATEHERVLLVLVQPHGEASRMQLRQQSFGEGIGWFTQSSVQLEPGQVADLRNALGLSAAAPRANRPLTTATRLPREFSKLSPQSWQPRVVHADSA